MWCAPVESFDNSTLRFYSAGVMNETFFCNKCGAQNSVGAQFCSRCGAPTNPAASATPPPPGSEPVGAYATTGPSYATPGTTAVPPLPSPGATYSAVNTQYPPYLAAGGVRYGGFWIRVVAAIVDHVLLRIVVAPVTLIFGGLGMASRMSGLPHRGLAILGGGVTVILLLFGSWLYEALMESSSYQATLGKMIFGMKVTDLSGNRISFERATGRHFAKYLSGMILGIGYIMVGLTERKQGLHDLLAGTLVRRS
jgi:uncharacterized RDD family membrane protein YckC